MLKRLFRNTCRNPGCENEPPKACLFCVECRLTRQGQGLTPGHPHAVDNGWLGFAIALTVCAGGTLLILLL